ncbi:hypothetical protein FACS189411_07990 [Bacteroidia bacterium]|nr:hypothetical protein FACS189411_07990 [Bacteroidia bacterium]
MKKSSLAGIILSGIMSWQTSPAQEMVYKVPPKEISDIVLAPSSPSVIISNNSQWLLLLDRAPFLSIAELSEPEYKLGGTRVSGSFVPSRVVGYSGARLIDIKTKKEYAIGGLPEDVHIFDAEWSPGSSQIALTVKGRDGYYLWLVSLADKQARQVSNRRLNKTVATTAGRGGGRTRSNWLSEESLIVSTVPSSTKTLPLPSPVPTGPVIQESDGKAAPVPTYQDLLKNPYDELLFDYLFTVQLVRISPEGEKEIGNPGIYLQVSLSPDKQYLLTSTINKPYSYIVPMQSFPQTYSILSAEGKLVKEIAKNPLTANGLGYDMASPFPRYYSWRPDKPSALFWVEAQDEGNPRKNKVPFMDAVYQLQAPFSGAKQLVAKTELRYQGIQWGDDTFALLSEGSRQTRRVKTYTFAPAQPEQKPVLLFDVSTDDNYADPGTPVSISNAYDKRILYTDKTHSELLLISDGASPEGDMPYLSRYNLKTKKNTILWRCTAPYYETIVDIVDPAKLQFITARQSLTEPINYYLRDTKAKKSDALTAFLTPYPQLAGMKVEKMKYKRADGLDLTASLYTPVGYDKDKNGRLPVLMWAYPREYRSANDAAQVRGSKYIFPIIDYRSPVFWVTRGFAVMGDVEMPIVGADGVEPNDNFISQLTMNAEAAAKAIYESGVGDTSRLAVGGHSYGAFMTSNLMTHTNIFKAGIARSGAYNRSLTPFGFQAETRTYWEAPEVYHTMSPFDYANNLSGALLLVHGDADNNTGTFPIQSERFYAALKGHGATTRFVLLPYESHSYSAKESILHLLYETDTWLNTYVKNKK